MVHGILVVVYAALLVLGIVIAAFAPTPDIRIVGIGIAIVATGAITLSASKNRKMQTEHLKGTHAEDQGRPGPSTEDHVR